MSKLLLVVGVLLAAALGAVAQDAENRQESEAPIVHFVEELPFTPDEAESSGIIAFSGGGEDDWSCSEVDTWITTEYERYSSTMCREYRVKYREEWCCNDSECKRFVVQVWKRYVGTVRCPNGH